MLHATLQDRLRCPSCGDALGPGNEATLALRCAGCAALYPVVRGVPILVDDARSMFQQRECAGTADRIERPRRLADHVRHLARRIVPKPIGNIVGEANLRLLARRLREETDSPAVLVIGGGSLGVGIDALVGDPAFRVVESDIVFGPRTNLVCDAQALPFADGTFDAVIAQAVFEYFSDPFQAADEIHRVLRPGGHVYAESPFMQQVHGGPYDFFRFTHVGHRRVFRRFTEVNSGVACGPGMALAWSYRYFLRSLAAGRASRAVTNAVGSLTSSWIHRFDERLSRRPGAFDAASAFYFLGTRADRALTDREILATYRGTWRMHR